MHAQGAVGWRLGDAWAALQRARAFHQQPRGLFWHALVWNALTLIAHLLWLEGLLHAVEAWLLRCRLSVDPAPSDGPGAWPFRNLGVGASPATAPAAPATGRPRTAPLRCDSAFAPSHKRNAPAARSAEHDGPPLLSALKPGLERLPSVSTISSSLDDLETDIDLDEPAPLTHSASYSFGDLKENVAPNAPAAAAPSLISACRAGFGSAPAAAPTAWGCAPKGAGLLRASSVGEGGLRKGEQPDEALALFMAQCAALAYARPGAAEAAVCGWGLQWEGSCGMERGGGAQQGGGALRPSWFAVSNAHALLLVFGGGSAVGLLSWRGAGAAADAWLASARHGRGQDVGGVCIGVLRALFALPQGAQHCLYDGARPVVAAAALRCKRVYLVGHGAGGALAAAFAALLHTWQDAPQVLAQVAGIYTFGAPAVGDAAFAALFDGAFAGRAHRYVTTGDIVPRLPLLPAASAAASASRYGSQYVHHCGLRELPVVESAAGAHAVGSGRGRSCKTGGDAPAAIVCQVSVRASGDVAGEQWLGPAGGLRASERRGRVCGPAARAVAAGIAAAARAAEDAATRGALAAVGAALPGVAAHLPHEYVRSLRAAAALV